MAIISGKDKTETKTNVSQVYLNNAPVPTSVNKAVEYVVINNKVVADPNQINPGVIINAQQTK